MQLDVKSDLQRSAAAFSSLVWPALSSLCGGGEISPVETVMDDGFIEVLDAYSGIDAWQVIGRRGVIRGVASRVQFGKSAYRTFTIRYSRSSGAKTEYEKRLHALKNIEKGYLYPHLTVQAYVSEDGKTLQDAAVIKTKDLFLHAEKLVFREKGDTLCSSCLSGTPKRCLLDLDCYGEKAPSCFRYTKNKTKPIGGFRQVSNASFIYLPWQSLARANASIAVLSERKIAA